MASVTRLVLATSWQIRVVGTFQYARESAMKIRTEWLVDLSERRADFAHQPVYLQIMNALVPQGTTPSPWESGWESLGRTIEKSYPRTDVVCPAWQPDIPLLPQVALPINAEDFGAASVGEKRRSRHPLLPLQISRRS